MATTEHPELTTAMNDPNSHDIIGSETIAPLDTLYYSIHAVAIVSLVISIVSSVIVIVWQQRAASAGPFFKRKLAERLVVYLAITDLFFSIAHFLDHLIHLVGHGSPSKIPCIIFASIAMECIFAQSIVVLLTAVSLCLLVTCNRKIDYGRGDVTFFLVSYGFPLITVTVALVKGYVGDQGYW